MDYDCEYLLDSQEQAAVQWPQDYCFVEVRHFDCSLSLETKTDLANFDQYLHFGGLEQATEVPAVRHLKMLNLLNPPKSVAVSPPHEAPFLPPRSHPLPPQ